LASEKKLIVVPKPGELLGLLGASGALADAIKSAAYDDYARTKLRSGLLSGPAPLKELDFDWLGETPARSYTAFKKEYLGEWPLKEPEPPVGKPLVDLDWGDAEPFMGIDWGADAVPGGITKQDVKDSLATLAKQSLKAEPLLGPKSMWDEIAKEEAGVDVVFWYYRDTLLVYSIRRVADNFFYDFATKKFSLLPVSPRAGMPRATPVTPSGFIYSTRLSGKLDDGEYVVTVRDSKADDVVVGITALFMKDGSQQGHPPQGLENTPIEEGIPTPEGTFRRAERRVRTVDTDGPT
jgi:hypothetical protein